MRRGDNRAWVVGDVAYIDVATPQHPRAVTLVDAADACMVLGGGCRWQAYYNPNSRRLYVVRREGPVGRRRTIYLHRFLLGLKQRDGLHGDHVNGNGLDNRRRNIRAATPAQNSANAVHGRGASRFKGVSRHHSGRWRAEICANRARQYLGIFDTEEAAARAYDARAREVHRGFARPNFSEAGHVHI